MDICAVCNHCSYYCVSDEDVVAAVDGGHRRVLETCWCVAVARITEDSKWAAYYPLPLGDKVLRIDWRSSRAAEA